MNEDMKIRVLVAGFETAGRSSGPQMMAAVLRDAGMEVVYAGNGVTHNQVINAVVQEDVRVIGFWLQNNTQQTIIKNIISSIEKKDIEDVLFIVCGHIAEEKIPVFEKMGIHKIFTSECFHQEMTNYILDYFKTGFPAF